MSVHRGVHGLEVHGTGGVHGPRGVHGPGGVAWSGGCMVRGVHVPGGMHGPPRRLLLRAVRILLEYILVNSCDYVRMFCFTCVLKEPSIISTRRVAADVGDN